MQFGRWMTGLAVLGMLLNLSGTVAAQQATNSGGSGQALLNLENTVALHGYDPVAYFKDGEAIRGRTSIFASLGGATYRFANRANHWAFLKEPTKYQPQFGGFCATSLSIGRLEDINPEEFAIYQGKLYVFQDGAARNLFISEPARISAEAMKQFFRIASEQRQNY